MCYPWERSSCAYLEGTVTSGRLLWPTPLTLCSSWKSVLLYSYPFQPQLLSCTVLCCFLLSPLRPSAIVLCCCCCCWSTARLWNSLHDNQRWAASILMGVIHGCDCILQNKVRVCSCWKVWVKNCWFLPPFTTMHSATGKPLCSVLPQYLLCWRCSPGADSTWCEV